MSAGTTSERIYEHIRFLVTRRHVRPGVRLDPKAIAKELEASPTPVREALNRLVGERLVESRDPGGFYLVALNEPALRDLYAWSHALIDLSLRAGSLEGVNIDSFIGGDYANRVAGLFSALAATSNNTQYRHEIASANARLHAIREVETEVFEDIESEFAELKLAMVSAPGPAIRKIVQTYHRRRERSVPVLIRRRSQTNQQPDQENKPKYT